MVCDVCGSRTKVYDHVIRFVRTKKRAVYSVKIPRIFCPNCNTIRRLLPDYIYPFKHYEAEIIQGVVNGVITNDILEYEDYPCESTMKRWCDFFSSRKKHLL